MDPLIFSAGIPSLPVYDSFITQLMPEANGTYVKVYLYLLHCSVFAGETVTTRTIAEKLHLIESDVLEAIRYWQRQGALCLQTQNGLTHLEFPSPAASEKKAADPSPAEAPAPLTGASLSPSAEAEEVPESPAASPVSVPAHTEEQESLAYPAPETTKIIRIEQKPNYSQEELNIYARDPLVSHLFEQAASVLGQIPSTNTLATLYSFYDYYRLPFEVIDYLLLYCSQNGHRDIRYIEKVAQDWADQHFQSKAQAQLYTRRKDRYFPVLHAMKIYRYPSDEDCRQIEHWFSDYAMSTELIVEACRRSANKNYAFGYIDGILSDWHAKGISNMEGVLADDQQHQKQTEAVKEDRPNRPSARKNAFLSYEQRKDVDWDAWERELADLTHRELSGNY